MFERFQAQSSEPGRCQGTTPSGGRFKVFDQGAHVTEWIPSEGADPVLFVSEKALYQPRIAIRGGIPLSFPWFAAGRKDNKSPAHGFARLADWRLLDGRESDGVTTLRWQLDESLIPRIDGVDADRNRFVLTCIQEFGENLVITLRTRNTDDVPLVIEQALHSYFVVGDTELAEVHGLSGVEYLDKVSGAFNTQIGPVTFSGEVDRIYWSSESAEIHDPVLRRRIRLETRNSRTVVVWNPGPEGAAGLRDLDNGEWKDFICVETANVRDKALHLNPGQAHDLVLTIRVAEL